MTRDDGRQGRLDLHSIDPGANAKAVGQSFPLYRVNLDEPEVKVILTRTAVRLLNRSGNCRQVGYGFTFERR